MKNKILIVDDDRYVSRLLEEMLKDEYTIETASNGLVALEKVYDYAPDIILLDLMMPHMNGYEVCEKIRSDNRLPYVKILLLSAKNFLDDRLKGYGAGANDYITKPFDPKEVKAKIKIFLQLKYANEVIRIKDDLLTLLSHEKNTPLNSIVGFSELLKQSKNLSGDEKNYVEYILNNAKDLQKNTRKTLLLCQLKGGFEISPIATNLHHITTTVLNQFQKMAEEKSLTFNFNAHSPEITLPLDPVLITEAISGIIENSIHYSFPSGIVTVDLQCTDTHCILSIIDEGEGVKAEYIDDIFSALFNEDVMKHTKGMGISLALSKAIIELHSGKIIAEHNTPAGAIFRVMLPLKNNLELND